MMADQEKKEETVPDGIASGDAQNQKREGEEAVPKTWFQGSSVRGDAPTVSIMKLAKPAVAERRGRNRSPLHAALLAQGWPRLRVARIASPPIHHRPQ